jgi:two-component system phosphate regulon sensor histidine kinase PhoR
VFRSIRTRITIPFIILILIAMLGLGLFLSRQTRQQYIRYQQTELLDAARMIGDAMLPDLESQADLNLLDEKVKHYAQLLNMRITIIDTRGVVLSDSDTDASGMENHLDRPEVAQALTRGEGSNSRFSETLGLSMLYQAIAVPTEGQPLGVVRVAFPLHKVEMDINQLQQTILLATLLAIALAIILAAIIADQTVSPLKELTKVVEGITNGNIKVGLTPSQSISPPHDEIGKLTEAFNQMAQALNTQINALESERLKSTAVLQEMSDGVFIVDNQGKVQLLNLAAERMFGASSENSLGASFAEVVRYHQLIELWQRCKDTGETQSAAVDINDKQIYLLVIATPLGKASPGNILLLIQNLTRLRQTERVRRDFISNISHELRTPLASLKALTETLQEGALNDPPAAHRFLGRMEKEVDALSLMVSELLELSRIESGQVPLHYKATSPCVLITQAVDRLRLQAERAGLTLQIECPPDLPNIQADPSRLEQVLVNLIHNAIKFTPSGGTITVRAQAGEFNQIPGMVYFSVRDTGIGIPPTELARIFERFYKTDRSRSGGGTGLGLAIARHMVEAHGGEIWAKSAENQGSTFYFYIPMAV